ncbi:MAG: YciI family protein [Rhodospirillaceae bacterium]|nr:YciI family protein [Rhodospirillaceae bacterium]MBL6942168.1 YciI family protein [Rhodospirillales bacterium]
MHFIIHCTDKPGAAQVRADNRPAHVDFLKARRDTIYTAGPTLTDDGEGMNGSLLIVDLPDRAAVDAFAAADPYAQAGLFESVVIKPWKQVFEPLS